MIPSGELVIRSVAAEDLAHLKVLFHAQQFFHVDETDAMLEEFLPLFQTSILADAFLSMYLVCGFLPTSSYKYSAKVLPSIFHLWNLMASSQVTDCIFIEFLSRWMRGVHLSDEEFQPLLSDEQLDYIFSHFLRMMQIPVGLCTGPSSKNLDAHARNLFFTKKYSAAKDMARLLIYMLPDDRVLSHLAVFFEATETFFHPSNVGAWLSPLGSILYDLTVYFQIRINRERSGETPAQGGRSLEPCKESFVRLLRKVTFMLTYSRSAEIQDLAQASLEGLAHLCPQLIIPGALKRVYPSLQGLVVAHRTTASLHYLASLTSIIAKSPVWRAHLTSLITLSLPGIDANDLNKTSLTLAFLMRISHLITIEDLSDTADTSLAMSWVQSEMSRLESLIGDDDEESDATGYSSEIDDERMLQIVRSSTAAWRDILTMFFDRIFLLLENLPPVAIGRASSEAQVSNDIQRLLPAFFAALSPELWDVAVTKILKFVLTRTLYDVTEIMSSILNSLCKSRAPSVWKEFYDPLDAAIRSEIRDNGAGSSRSAGNEVLPRDRALIWYLRCIEGMIDAGGSIVLEYSAKFRALVTFVMDNCVSQATEYIGILLASFIEGLVEVYPTDLRRINPDEQGSPDNGLESWCIQPDARKLIIRWHVPSRDEISEAVDFFLTTSESLLAKIEDTIETSKSSQGKVRQEWTDVLVSQLSYTESLLCGATELFSSHRQYRSDEEIEMTETNYSSRYPCGYVFGSQEDPLCIEVHRQRTKIGEMLHRLFAYLMYAHTDNILVFDILLLTYKCWLGNVGYQRSDGSHSKLNNIYVEDISQFKMPGKRKHYPRQYLVRRALLYHVQRRKHNALASDPTPLHWALIEDLQKASIGQYTEIRIIAQSALNQALRAVAKTRSKVIPFFLDVLQPGEEESIKGALFMLSGKGLKTYLGRDYQYFPTFLKRLVLLSNVEKPSLQLAVRHVFMECAVKSRPSAGICLYEKIALELLKPKTDSTRRIADFIHSRETTDSFRDGKQAELRDDLVDLTQLRDWRIAMTATSALGASISSITLSPSVALATSILKLSLSEHPHLRTIATGHLIQLLATCWIRVLTKGNKRDAVLENLSIPGKIVLKSQNNAHFGRDILLGLKDPKPGYFIDNKRAGWLAWPQELEAFERDNGGVLMEVDEETSALFAAMGPAMNLEWMSRMIEYWKEEPKEGHAKFRDHLQHFIRFFFVCSRKMPGAVSLEELKSIIEQLCSKISLPYHSRVGAELISGIIGSLRYESDAIHDDVWSWCGPLLKEILVDRLTPDNLTYWQHCVCSVFLHRDPRRSFPLLEVVSNLPLDMESHSAFAESAKIMILRKMVSAIGWHFQSGDGAIEKFIAHVDHPYKRVRDEIGRALNNLFAMQYFESHSSVTHFIEANVSADSSLGVFPYKPDAKLTATMDEIFSKLRTWRSERTPGQVAPSQYTTASKTILTWIFHSVDLTEAYLLLPFVPDLILPEILHMLDLNEDPDLMTVARGVFLQLGNIVYPTMQIQPMVDSLVRTMTEDPIWHHRIRILGIVQVFFYRNMFILSRADRKRLFDALIQLMSDSQLECRQGAASTISGMIRASSYDRENTINSMIAQFTQVLEDNPLPRNRNRSRRKSQVLSVDPAEVSANISARHSAVLGLSALVYAFPYDTPPKWLPAVLARIARCADNPHPIAASVKRVLASFKKTHNDTWSVDQKLFTQEELDDVSEPSHTYFS